jgi:hypothetical protein
MTATLGDALAWIAPGMDRNSLTNRLGYQQFSVIFPNTFNRFSNFRGATYHLVRIYCRFDMRWGLCESGTSKSCNWRVSCYTNRLIGRCNCFHLDTRKADRNKYCQCCHLVSMIRWRIASNRPNDEWLRSCGDAPPVMVGRYGCETLRRKADADENLWTSWNTAPWRCCSCSLLLLAYRKIWKRQLLFSWTFSWCSII